MLTSEFSHPHPKYLSPECHGETNYPNFISTSQASLSAGVRTALIKREAQQRLTSKTLSTGQEQLGLTEFLIVTSHYSMGQGITGPISPQPASSSNP